MNPPPAMATCSYAEFRTDAGTAVRTSWSAPRWKLPYRLEHSIRDLFPPRDLMGAHVPPNEFSSGYRAHLDTLGVDAIVGQLEWIADGDPRPLVLLCFERLSNGKACHRRDFASWWDLKTGQYVPELGSALPDPLPF